MNENLDKPFGSVLKVEGFHPEDVRAFLNAAQRLVAQGERFHSRNNVDTKMVLFIGTSGSNLIDMQVQGGGKLRQLIVCAIDRQSKQAMTLYLNWQDPERTEHPHLPERVEKFVKGKVTLDILRKIEDKPVSTADVSLSDPANNNDLKKLTDILEKTTIDKYLLNKLIEHERRMNHYIHEVEPKKPWLSQTVSKLLSRGN